MAHYRDAVTNYDLLNLGDFELQCGMVLTDAKLEYLQLMSEELLPLLSA